MDLRLSFLVCFMCLSAVAGAQGTPEDAETRTRAGWELGGQVANYEYEEPDFAKLEGERIGVVGAYTALGKHNLHTRLDGRLSYALLDYTGSGTKSNVEDLIFEARVVVGKDLWSQRKFAVSPYFGLGYRYLYNDLRGTTSDGSIGYRRHSTYLYVPIGTVLRLGLSGRWELATTIEYDAFLGGRQYSQLTDTNLGFVDASNRQKHGRGYRVYVMLESDKWAVGPWFHYWNIKDSDVVQIAANVGGLEPANTTREGGFEIRYRF